MISKTTVWIIFAAVAVAVAIELYLYTSNEGDTLDILNRQIETASDTSETLPAPTSNIDEIVKDLSDEATAEQGIATEEDERSLLEADLQTFDELGQSINENDF